MNSADYVADRFGLEGFFPFPRPILSNKTNKHPDTRS